ncbi:uncharacterized protein LOC112593909 [Melanaphis sacchari]|uniref:uncharacterized protein LOC112593909 n=1 Tax=Melanaphis sacchari TaxID=742174 RepID=UPI000DC13ECF|nr:uncharacterized protein LOC112593909 [Melanaphis sacchari]XP_025194283.1 uncharacterized protein LOC112593909 [Melanaphis sacchari]XP_025194285.1 uncharacterized protein LOC112593909 [Melanaphis sacchari]
MKSAESMRTMLYSFIDYEPYVSLEKIDTPIWMVNEHKNDKLTNGVLQHLKLKTEETEKLTNEEPNCKKIKNEETEFEVPKLTLSKYSNKFKSKLKYSKLQLFPNSHLKSLPEQLNIKNEAELSNNEELIIIDHNMKKETTKIKESVTNNSSLFGKIKVRNVHSINANFADMDSNIKYFDTEKSNISQTDTSFVFPSLGTKKLTLLCFGQLHKKYFNKTVQDTLVINNNLLFMNMLTNIHCISQVNLILTREDKDVMAKKVNKLSVLYINYFEKLDKMLQKNIIDLLSIFEDSDYEHGFLMIILSLFIGLKMLSSKIFQKSNVLLNKLQKLQWKVINDKSINKIQTTLESDTFCSCYYKMSELIGEGSHTDPNIIECWKLLFIPAVLKITNFNSVVDAIINATDIDKLDGLLEEASNRVRQNSSSINETEIKNLIALVNNSAQKYINSSDEITQSSTSKLTTIENDRSISILNENTPHMFLKRSLRIKESTMTMPNHKSKVCGTKNISTTVPENSKDWFKKPFPIQSQNTSTRRKTSKFQDLKTHYDDNSSEPLLSIAERVKLRKTRNTLTPISTTFEDSRKKLRSIKSEYISTSSIVHTRTLRSSKLNINSNNPPKKRLKKVHTPNCVKINDAKNTSATVSSKPNDLLKIPFLIKNENSSTPLIFYMKTSEQNKCYKNSPLLATTSLIKQEEIDQVRNCSTKFLTNNCPNKTVNSTIKTVNVQHGLNGNQIISK